MMAFVAVSGLAAVTSGIGKPALTWSAILIYPFSVYCANMWKLFLQGWQKSWMA